MNKVLNFVDQKVRKNYSIWDLGLLKTYGAIPGLLIGAYFPDFIIEYTWLLIGIFIILMTRFIYLIFLKVV